MVPYLWVLYDDTLGFRCRFRRQLFWTHFLVSKDMKLFYIKVHHMVPYRVFPDVFVADSGDYCFGQISASPKDASSLTALAWKENITRSY